MRKYLMPIGAVLAGLAASELLQGAGVAAGAAKLAGLLVAGIVVLLWWRRKAAL